MRPVVLVLALAACSFKPGVTGGAADAIPGEAGVVDTDRDDDTIEDAVDNCPAAANLDQANEDNDDRGDACDRCPHMAGTDTPGSDGDADGDDIGDQCDPRVGADRLVVFLGFNASADLMAFQSRSGGNMWSISGGALHQQDVNLATANQIVWTGESITGEVVAHTTATIDGMSAGVGTRLAAVVAGWHDASTVDAYACGLRSPDAGMQAQAAAWHFVNPPALTVTPVSIPDTFLVGLEGFERIKVTSQGASSTLDCLVGTTPVSQGVTSYTPIGYPGFRTLGVTASFNYLFVVALGP